ncbi:lactonase family protein [Fulvivirga ligni]|uniref:lactonase family protein n=1 Tax=Fulvivirga ligni TaxID=2904246 RepID=UPI001F3E18F4|nr:lactonase family protein [Fulvivirga ligni]UII20135.1 lactonase family protein [Fulvivirga ligni]
MSCQKPASKDENEIEEDSLSTMRSKPDKKLLYVGTYTRKEGHVDGKAEGIYLYELDMHTGKLEKISTTRGIVNPSYLTIHSSGDYVYAVSETVGNDSVPTGSVYAYKVEADSTLRELNHVSSEGKAPCFITTDPSGKYVLVANYVDGVVALYTIAGDGSLESKMHVQHEGSGTTARQESAHAHSVWPIKNGFVYAVDLGIDQIIPYRLDEGKDSLEASSFVTKLPAGSGPRHLAFHPTKKIAYSINELKGTVTSFDIADNGELRSFQTLPAVEDTTGVDAGSADIHITPDGRFLYASNRGKFNNIAIFKINEETGELSLVGHQPTKGDAPRNFVIDPTGKFLLVANQNSSNVVTFEIDKETGELIDIGVETEIPTPVCLQFMP